MTIDLQQYLDDKIAKIDQEIAQIFGEKELKTVNNGERYKIYEHCVKLSNRRRQLRLLITYLNTLQNAVLNNLNDSQLDRINHILKQI